MAQITTAHAPAGRSAASGQARIGCSGWNYRDWRGRLYQEGEPARRWLELYSQRFDTVEVNATFYRLPSRQVVEHWVQQTGTGFLFAVKASRYLTHVKRLGEIRDGVARLCERLRPLIDAGRMGPMLWQLPDTFHRDQRRLEAALAELPPGRHAFELRHPSWFVEEVYAALGRAGAALVIADHPERRFQTEVETTDWRYVRLHYGSGRRGNYTPTDIDRWAAKLRAWRADGDVFVYFNNDWEGFAPANAAALRERV